MVASHDYLWISGLVVISVITAVFVLKSFTPYAGRRDAKFTLGLYLILLLSARLPTYFADYPFNPDEAQYVAQAMTFLKYPIPWTHLDTTTGGPLGSYILIIPSLIGINPSYALARIVAAILIWASCLYGYKTLRLILTESWALVTISVAVLFWAFSSDYNYIHYSSELLPVLLLTTSFYYLSKAFSSNMKFGTLLASIAIASLVPFAKLQAVVIAIPIAIIGIIYCVRRIGFSSFLRKSPWILLSGVSLPALILLPVCLSGGWSDFVNSYLLLGLNYGIPDQALKTFVKGVVFIAPDLFIAALLQLTIATLTCCILWLFPGGKDARREALRRLLKWPAIPALVVLFASMYAVGRPGTDFAHYWQLAILPSVVITGLFVSRMHSENYPLFSKLPLIGLFGSFVYARTWWSFVFFFFGVENSDNRTPGTDTHAQAAITFLEKNKKPGDRMTVWGWMPDFHVQTGLLPGTREVCTQLIVPDLELVYRQVHMKDDLRSYYKDRFMRDLEKSKPAFIVDACYPAAFLFSSRQYAPESFPVFREFLEKYYTISEDTSTEEVTGIRIWTRRE